MAIETDPQPITIGSANYWQVTAIDIQTPTGGDKKITARYGAYERTAGVGGAADSYNLLQEYIEVIEGADLLVLASSAPVGNNLNDVIKHGIYAYLQSKGLIPSGTSV